MAADLVPGICIRSIVERMALIFVSLYTGPTKHDRLEPPLLFTDPHRIHGHAWFPKILWPKKFSLMDFSFVSTRLSILFLLS
jgi:hypothetical protein